MDGRGFETNRHRLGDTHQPSKGRKSRLSTASSFYSTLKTRFIFLFGGYKRARSHELCECISFGKREKYIFPHHCHQEMSLNITVWESLCYQNQQQIRLRIGSGGQDRLSKEMEKAEVSDSYIPCGCIVHYYGTIYVLVKSNLLVYK